MEPSSLPRFSLKDKVTLCITLLSPVLIRYECAESDQTSVLQVGAGVDCRDVVGSNLNFVPTICLCCSSPQ